MTKNQQNIKLTFFFILVITAISINAYFIFTETSNFFQDLLGTEKKSPTTFIFENQIGICILITILAFILNSKFEELGRQKYLLLILGFINIFLHINLDFYPFILGINNAITTLTSAWIQTFCPPALRGFISGQIEALYSVIDLLSVYIKHLWDLDIDLAHVSSYTILFLMVLGFYIFTKISIKINKTPKPENLLAFHLLVKKYLFLFLACLMVGINQGVFSFSYEIAEIVLPNDPPKIFQYCVTFSSVLFPFLFGVLGDKFGLMRTLFFSLISITIVHFSNALAVYFDISESIVYYSIYSLDAGLSAFVEGILMAVFGKYLLKQGLFRSFALFGILINLGSILCGVIYEKFSPDFGAYQLFVGLANASLLTLLWLSYQRFKLLEAK